MQVAMACTFLHAAYVKCILASLHPASLHPFCLRHLSEAKKKEKFTLFSDGDGGLLRRQP